MKASRMFISLAGLIVGLAGMAALVACGASSESAPAAPAQLAAIAQESSDMARVMPRAMPAMPQAASAPQAPAAAPAPAPAPTAPPAPMAMVSQQMEADDAQSEGSQVGEFSEEQAALVAQNRIIIRTVNLDIEVDDVVDAIELISQNAQRDGGWVVGTDRSSKHYGFIAVRVPAAKLDETLKWMRQVGVDVLSESSTSTDVTDEYYDLRSRAESLQATEEALLRLLDRAEKVEDALEVQRELAILQADIEAHLGRIKLLEETAAFSLVNISLNLAPQEMRVDAGADRTFSVGEVARFRATFYPPEGIDDFDYTWDFRGRKQISCRNRKRPSPRRRPNYGDRSPPVPQRSGIPVHRRDNDKRQRRSRNRGRFGYVYSNRH